MRRLVWAVAIGIAVLAGCSGGGSGPSIPPPSSASPAPATTGTPIPVGATLSDGTGVTLNESVVPASAVRAVSRDPQETLPAFSSSFGSAPGTVTVSFATPLPAASNTRDAALATAVQLRLAYDPSRASAIEAARAPVVTIERADGTVGRLIIDGTVDTTNHIVSVNVPAGLLANATAVKLSLASDPMSLPPPQSPGPRYWTGTAWSTSGTILPNVKTLVLEHGIISSVETAYPAQPSLCPQLWANAGGYGQVLGFDYDWTLSPSVNGPLLANFLATIHNAGVSQIDMVAHSYGTLTTLAALETGTTSQDVQNVTMLGGPLPLRGSPLAGSPFMRTVLSYVASYAGVSASEINRALAPGNLVSSLVTNGPTLQALKNGYPTNVRIAGGAGQTQYAAETVADPILFWYITYPWDGVVEQIAADSNDVNLVLRSFYPQLRHTDLPCSSLTIAPPYSGG